MLVNLASFSAGIAFAWSSPTIPQLNGSIDPENNPLGYSISPSEESWIASLVPLGSAFGPVIFGYLADKLGRKNALLLAMIPLIVSFLMKAFASNIITFYFARAIGGFGSGGVFTVVPIFMGEIAEDRNRGALGCFMPVFCSMGFIFSYCVGPFVSIMWFSLVSAVPSALFIIFVFPLAPESPHYLVSKNKDAAASKSLHRLRNISAVHVSAELKDVKKYVEDSFSNKGKLKDFFSSRGLRLGIITTVGLMMVQQGSGINVFLSYMNSIFAASASSIPSDVSTIIIAVVQTIIVCVTSLVIDKLGRRLLLLISAGGTCLAQVFMGTYFYMKDNKYEVDQLSWLPMSSLVLFMIAYNLGIGPLPWAILGEIFPPNMKSVASTVTTTSCLCLSFLMTMVFPYFIIYIGMAQSFWFFSCCCLCGTFFVFCTVPETKGKSLQEIQVMLNKKDAR